MSDQPPLTPPPTAPAIGDDDNTFNTRAFALVAWLATFVSELTALVTYVVGKVTAAAASASDAETSASEAAASAVSAAAVANFQGVYSGANAYTTGQSVYYNGDYWIALQGSTGQTPAVGSAYWALAPGQPAERFLDTLPPATLDLKFGEHTRYAKADGIVEARLDSFATYSRGGDVVNYFGASGFLVQSGVDEPAVEYDPFTRFIRGLLFEPTRTNDVLHSNDFSNGVWLSSDIDEDQDETGVDNVANSAWTFTENTDNSSHRNYQDFTIVDGESRVGYIIAKPHPTNPRDIRLELENTGDGSDFYAIFDLTTGAQTGSGASGSGVLINSDIYPLSNGFYFCWIAGTLGSGTSARLQAPLLLNGAGSGVYAGDGASGVIVYASGSTEGDIPTSHIVTGASAVTRAADSLLIDDPIAKNILNVNEGTLLIDLRMLAYPSSGVAVSRIDLYAGSTANRLVLQFLKNGALPVFQVLSFIGGVLQDNCTSGFSEEIDDGRQILAAFSYSKGENLIASLNGETVACATGDAWDQNLDHIEIPQSTQVSAYNSIGYRPKRLTQAQLNRLTRNS